ncbi:hypothetical protein OIDMADRAFT_25283 [Oidiodendron maius Zn]|uniref:Uncharacterized protein n=1 Tax=Oidiodendron maius (strain Zn) TaxID=913774 RepID=A0A0C3HQY1_OIDMZ|nr:hypothetical protein OIDMADRAFT_25283 [Oidiodendron maius Zn]
MAGEGKRTRQYEKRPRMAFARLSDGMIIYVYCFQTVRGHNVTWARNQSLTEEPRRPQDMERFAMRAENRLPPFDTLLANVKTLTRANKIIQEEYYKQPELPRNEWRQMRSSIRDKSPSSNVSIQKLDHGASDEHATQLDHGASDEHATQLDHGASDEHVTQLDHGASDEHATQPYEKKLGTVKVGGLPEKSGEAPRDAMITDWESGNAADRKLHLIINAMQLSKKYQEAGQPVPSEMLVVGTAKALLNGRFKTPGEYKPWADWKANPEIVDETGPKESMKPTSCDMSVNNNEHKKSTPILNSLAGQNKPTNRQDHNDNGHAKSTIAKSAACHNTENTLKRSRETDTRRENPKKVKRMSTPGDKHDGNTTDGVQEERVIGWMDIRPTQKYRSWFSSCR